MPFPKILQPLILAAFTITLLGGCAHMRGVKEDTDELTWKVPSPPAPSVVWVSAGSFRKAERTPEDVVAIVIHTTEGSYNKERSFAANQARNFRGNVNYFRKNERNVSAHFVIGPNGEICQMVNETDVAHTQTYYNDRAIGIECAGWAGRKETWTPELLDSLVNLVAFLSVKWEIPAYQPEGTAHEGPNRIEIENKRPEFTGAGLVGHYQVQPWNKTDPGKPFPWEEFEKRVQDRIREFGQEPIEL